MFPRPGSERRDPGHLLVHERTSVRDHQGLQAVMRPEPVQERGQVQGALEHLPVCLREPLGLHRALLRNK